MKNKSNPNLQRRGKYTNLPYTRSEARKLNFGSNSLQRKPISLHPVNMNGKSDNNGFEFMRDDE